MMVFVTGKFSDHEDGTVTLSLYNHITGETDVTLYRDKATAKAAYHWYERRVKEAYEPRKTIVS